jgi:hypothetical protein
MSAVIRGGGNVQIVDGGGMDLAVVRGSIER